MDQGVWAWSRHPNYFGEFGFWLALGLFGLAASPSDWWWLSSGRSAMLAMFLGASIPMMEKRSLERRPAYQRRDRPGPAASCHGRRGAPRKRRVTGPASSSPGSARPGVLTAVRLADATTSSASPPSPRW